MKYKEAEDFLRGPELMTAAILKYQAELEFYDIEISRIEGSSRFDHSQWVLDAARHSIERYKMKARVASTKLHEIYEERDRKSKAIVETIRSLSCNDQIKIVLYAYYVCGMSVDEIAAMMSASVPYVYKMRTQGLTLVQVKML